MQIHEIEIIIDAAGNVQLHVLGVKGAPCLELTKDLERSLGGNVTGRELTSEAAESEESSLPAWQQIG